MGPEFHGLTIVIWHPWKSSTFRVASVALLDRAIAAICASIELIGLPEWRRSATIPA